MFDRAPAPPTRRPGTAGLVLPFLLIAVGAMLLLNNLGIVPFSIWSTLAQLWPVILILVGIEFLVGRRQPGLGVVIAILGLLVILGIGLWWTPRPLVDPGATRASASPSITVSAVPIVPTPPLASSVQGINQSTTRSTEVTSLGETKRGKVALNVGAGELAIRALPADSQDLAQANASLPSSLRLSRQQSTRGDFTETTFNVTSDGFHWPFAQGDQGYAEIAIGLTRQIPLSLEAKVGAGQSEIDLTNLTITDLSLNTGAGQTTVRFPSTAGSQLQADIQSGAGQLTLIIPPEVGAYLHTSTGLVNLNLPRDRFIKVADGYRSTNDQTASSRLDLSLHMGVGEVDVR